MGKILKINPSLIKPSQDFIKEDTFNFIKETYRKGDFDKLPPTPIVRKGNNDTLIAIDGHNLLAFYSLMQIDCEVYVAENKEDVLEGGTAMIKKRNKDLFEKYDYALEQSILLDNNHISSISDLCKFADVTL